MSTKEFGCFACSGKASDSSVPCPECGRPIDISELLVGTRVGAYEIEGVIGRGFYGWTVRGNDNYQTFAIKIVPVHRLGAGDRRTDAEAAALAACSAHRNIARFFTQFESQIQVGDTRVDAICLVFEFIDGARTLRQFVEDARTLKPSKQDVVDVLAGAVSGLSRLHSKTFWHHDLHDDNILVRQISEDENLPERFEAKLIDFGSARAQVEGQQEDLNRGDYQYLSKHYYALAGALEHAHRDRLSPSDRAFASRLRTLGHRLADSDVNRRNVDPESLYSETKRLLSESSVAPSLPPFVQMASEARISLADPLDISNALLLGHQDVAALFTDRLAWEDQISKAEPVIVVGPRGCGKTMLFRYLSLASQVRPRRGETKEQVAMRLDDSKHLGFLVKCSDLRTPFIRSAYKTLVNGAPSVAEEYCREYISTHFLSEVVRTVSWLYSEEIAALSKSEVASLVATISSLLAEQEETFRTAQTLEGLSEVLDRRAMRLSNLTANAHYAPSAVARDDVLLHIATALRTCNWFAKKEIWFLLDDYSVTVLPDFVQQSYNPVLFRLSPGHRVRVSSEGDGPSAIDQLGRKFREGREYVKVSLGEIYFSVDDEQAQGFLEAILANRFSEVGEESLEEFKEQLGEHPHTKGFAKYILRLAKPGSAEFYGFSLLCRLCSGDISFLIDLFRAIKDALGRGAPGDSAKIQNGITKSYARRQLADLRQIAEYGTRIYQFADGLGGLLREYLLATEKGSRPDERLRIEVEGDRRLSDEARQMHEQLLRHSVLVEGGYGKSRSGAPTKRLFFRRMYAPCFPFSPNRRGCVAISVDTYEKWLLHPDQIRRRARSWEGGLGRAAD